MSRLKVIFTTNDKLCKDYYCDHDHYDNETYEEQFENIASLITYLWNEEDRFSSRELEKIQIFRLVKGERTPRTEQEFKQHLFENHGFMKQNDALELVKASGGSFQKLHDIQKHQNALALWHTHEKWEEVEL